jgi:hypothetical protein
MTDQLVGRKYLRTQYRVGERAAERWTRQESFPKSVAQRGREILYRKAEVDDWVWANCTRTATFGDWRYVAPENRTITKDDSNDRKER